MTESNHLGEDRILPAVSGEYVTDQVKAEVEMLTEAGIDVKIVDYGLDGHYQLDTFTQARVDKAIDAYSQNPELIKAGLKGASAAVAGWLEMAEAASPLALSFFYNTGGMERPSDGLSEKAILHTPLPLIGEEPRTASDIIRDTNDSVKAEAELQMTKRFFEAGSMKDEVDGFGLSTYELMAGSLDRIADVTRAKALQSLVLDHVHEYPERYEGRGFVSASLASGAAEPVYWLVDALHKEGHKIKEVNLVDQNPVALAASLDRSTYYDLNDKVKLYHKNLLRGKLDSYIDPQSADVVDIIGLFEYFKPRSASKLLELAKPIVRPGGMIVFGNMLDSRAQQEWFNGIWPDLEQRSIAEVIEIVEAAGFSRDQLKIRIPKDGIYAVYGIEIPLTASDMTRTLGHVASL